MALLIGDNFNYQGKKPNFERDSFDTVSDMKNYAETSINDGHLSYCKSTKKFYVFNSSNDFDDTFGKWREFTINYNINTNVSANVFVIRHNDEDYDNQSNIQEILNNAKLCDIIVANSNYGEETDAQVFVVDMIGNDGAIYAHSYAVADGGDVSDIIIYNLIITKDTKWSITSEDVKINGDAAFTTINVGDNTLNATDSNKGFTLEAGDNIQFAVDTDNNKITIDINFDFL